MHRHVRATVALALAAAMVAAATPAAAFVDADYSAIGVRIRRSPSLSATIDGLGYPGQGARLWCWRTGSSVGGNTLWYYHTNRTTAVVGYSHDSLIDWGGTTGLNPC